MSLSQIYRPGRCGLSFELYPPKSAAGETAMFGHLRQLMTYRPDFITCTYGAGGSTREKTLEIVCQVKRTLGIPVASHLTCVGSTVDQLREYLQQAADGGVDHIVALRGDPPRGEAEFCAVEGGLRFANELVALLRAEFPHFGVAVAGYPEKHLEAPTREVDLANLKRKVDAGADVIITQLFYRNDVFFRFRDCCMRIGITVPVVPGILPVTNLAQIRRITSMCGAHLPNSLVDALQQKDDADWQFQVGVDFAIAQVEQLVQEGVPGIHFYVLNKSQATSCVMQAVELPR
ncbi:MAG: methylenetetrahydrofolate reductase [NAD(P)H] [Planctomycetes bacterium]|nr:methylenetetrahydrofolate reductase [NAD(P)H] [Planctomycetota bacterium]